MLRSKVKGQRSNFIFIQNKQNRVIVQLFMKTLKKMPKIRNQGQGQIHVFPIKMTTKVKVNGQGKSSRSKVKGQGHSKLAKMCYWHFF